MLTPQISANQSAIGSFGPNSCRRFSQAIARACCLSAFVRRRPQPLPVSFLIQPEGVSTVDTPPAIRTPVFCCRGNRPHPCGRWAKSVRTGAGTTPTLHRAAGFRRTSGQTSGPWRVQTGDGPDNGATVRAIPSTFGPDRPRLPPVASAQSGSGDSPGRTRKA